MKSITISNDESFEIKVMFKGKHFTTLIATVDSLEYTVGKLPKAVIRSFVKPTEKLTKITEDLNHYGK